MALFRRRNRSSDDNSNDNAHDGTEGTKGKGGLKRPANTAFKQQRLKAWQPILTPKTVLPTFFVIALAFGVIGGLLIWGSGSVTEMTFDYTQCENLPASDSTKHVTYSPMPSSAFSYRLKSGKTSQASSITTPEYGLSNSSGQATCFLRFSVPYDLDPSVFLYYKLTNFYQNHRRYVKSIDTNQLKGEVVTKSGINDCSPLDLINDTMIYPCGLIANSLFNDTLSNLILLDPQGSNQPNSTYNFTQNNIAWPGEAKKYATKPGNNVSEGLLVPPGWVKRYGERWNDTNPPPNFQEDQLFQNWMRTAGLPTFSKLYGRNDDDTLTQGTYVISVDMNFPVQSFKGTKSVVISTVSWIGGKNPFLGWAYIASAGLFMFLAIAGTARHLIKPRRLGDMNLLSWNQQ